MGNILNPANENSFARLAGRKDRYLFVDKSDFIEITNNRFNEDNRFMAVTRPRRFGKTVTAHMLLAYYSREYAGQKIFDNLKIAKAAGYTEHLNMHDVIYIDMNSIKDKYISYKSDSSLYIDGIDDIVDFLQYMVIRDLKENKDYAEQTSSDPLIGKKSLSSALEAIRKHTGEPFIFIMDEWDLIYREYRNEGALQEKFIEFLRGLFKSDSGKACFALAYLTGILPIKKYNSQSALNGFDEYNMLTPGDYAAYFGFTENEVANIVKSPNCKISRQKLKEWYEGYKIRGVDIYNPNSVCKAVSRNECISYWSGTSSNEEFVRLVFSLLVCLGYLGCSETKNQYRKVAYVPNAEIRAVLMDIVREQNWYGRMETIKRSENLLKAVKELDGSTVATIIQDIHNSPAVALLDYNDEESLTYCVMTGLLWSTLDDYSYHREDQAGNGLI